MAIQAPRRGQSSAVLTRVATGHRAPIAGLWVGSRADGVQQAAPGRACRVRPFSRLALAAMLVAALASGCSKPVAAPDAPQTVLATTVVAAQAKGDVVYAGEVRARFETPLSFRIAGQLKERLAHLGDRVHRGQILATLDPADLKASLDQAHAALAAAEQRLTLARQTHERNLAQSKDDLISQSDLEQSAANLTVSQADVDERRAELARAQNSADYTRLLAPGEGIITSEGADVGAVVAPGQSVFGFAFSGERDVFIDLPESRLAEVVPGSPAEVTLWSIPGRTFAASVREVAQAADPQSRTYRVKLSLAAPDALVHPGMTASVRLGLHGAAAAASGRAATGQTGGGQSADEKPALLVIPASALFHKGEAPAVWVITGAEHILELRPVTVAGYGASSVELSGGVVPGDWIVAQGVHTVSAGQKVTPALLDPFEGATPVTRP